MAAARSMATGLAPDIHADMYFTTACDVFAAVAQTPENVHLPWAYARVVAARGAQ